jgi:hypothetical protein
VWALSGVVRVRWSEQILDEVFDNLIQDRPDLDPTLLSRTRTLMNDAVHDAMISGFEHLIAGLELPDRDDRHVLAAAIHSGSEIRRISAATLNPHRTPADLVSMLTRCGLPALASRLVGH